MNSEYKNYLRFCPSSIFLIFSSLLKYLSSGFSFAFKNVFITSSARESPIIPPPRHKTFISSSSTPWCAEKTMEFISQKRDGPWLASVNFYDPHPPFNPPKLYRELFNTEQMPDPLFRETDLTHQKRLEHIDFQSRASNPDQLDIQSPILPHPPGQLAFMTDGARDARTLKAAYYAMIRLIDDQIGRILDFLEHSGQRENTVIIFSSDHGESLGDHGLILKGCRFYEGLVRVPLIVSSDRFVSGLRSNALVELIDIAPTLIEIAGEITPAHMQGQSLLPLLLGAVPSDHHREFVRSEYIDALDLPGGTFATMYYDGRYKISVYHGHDVGELYDLQEDPGEFNDLWDDKSHTDLKLRLIQRSFDATILAIDTGLPRVGPI